MKHTISSLAKFADSVNRRKFIALSLKKKHELLAALAYSCLKSKNYNGFLKRYEELNSWVEMDRYTPPTHLSNEEALKLCFDFHNSFLFYPLKEESSDENTKEGNSTAKNVKWNEKFNITVYADEIRSPYNIGSIIRLIDNFGFKELVLSSDSIDLNHPRLKKTARGAEKWIPVRYEKDPADWLKRISKPVIALETGEGSIDIRRWTPPDEAVIIAGNEEHGVSSAILELCTDKINIPMYGYKNSMNVTHALAVLGHKIISSN